MATQSRYETQYVDKRTKSIEVGLKVDTKFLRINANSCWTTWHLPNPEKEVESQFWASIS